MCPVRVGERKSYDSQQGALDLGIGSPNDRRFRMATLGCHTGQSRVGGTSRSENLLQQILVKADMEQSLGGPAEEGAPSPRLPAVVGGEKTAGMRREAAQGQMIGSVSDQWGGKLGRAVQLEHAEYNAGKQGITFEVKIMWRRL